jgi:hypothetical protein
MKKVLIFIYTLEIYFLAIDREPITFKKASSSKELYSFGFIIKSKQRRKQMTIFSTKSYCV